MGAQTRKIAVEKGGHVADLECIFAGIMDRICWHIIKVKKRAELENTAWSLARTTLREMTLEKGRTKNMCVLGSGEQ